MNGDDTAFPTRQVQRVGDIVVEETVRGLTKREYMATQILAGMIGQFTSRVDASTASGANVLCFYERKSVVLAVNAADALLEELEK